MVWYVCIVDQRYTIVISKIQWNRCVYSTDWDENNTDIAIAIAIAVVGSYFIVALVCWCYNDLVLLTSNKCMSAAMII